MQSSIQIFGKNDAKNFQEIKIENKIDDFNSLNELMMKIKKYIIIFRKIMINRC